MYQSGGDELPGFCVLLGRCLPKLVFTLFISKPWSWAGCVTHWVVKSYRGFQTEMWNIYMVADVCGNISGKI